MNQAIVAVMAALTIWLCTNTAKTNNVQDNSSANTKMINAVMDRLLNLEQSCCKKEEVEVIPEEVPESDESVSFNEIFSSMRTLHGPDQIFVWNGEEYSTNYKEETINQ